MSTYDYLRSIIDEPPKPRPELVGRDILFGGVDLAKRIDSSCLTVLRLSDGILHEADLFQWPHVKYAIVAKGVKAVHAQFPMELIGIDRSGVGDAALELFDDKFLPLNPIVTTNKMKLDAIHVVRILFGSGRLKITRGSQLEKEIGQQHEKVTKAGNTTYEHSGPHDDQFWSLAYACYSALPYLVNLPPAIIKQGFESNAFESADFEKMIDKLMGMDAQIQRF